MQPNALANLERRRPHCSSLRARTQPTFGKAAALITSAQIHPSARILVELTRFPMRVLVALGPPVKCGDIALHAFPSAENLNVAGDDILLATGLSENKLAKLRRVANALLSSSLNEAMLEERPSPDAVEILRRSKESDHGRPL